MAGVTVHLNAPDGRELPRGLLERAVRLTAAREGVVRGEFSVTFLADDAIRELNRSYLSHDWVPDVLAFGLHGEGEPPLGDIYVGIDQALRQAREVDVDPEEELVRLAIHGTLHVLGHDHPDEEVSRTASPLYRLQERLLAEALDEDSGGNPEEGENAGS